MSDYKPNMAMRKSLSSDPLINERRERQRQKYIEKTMHRMEPKEQKEISYAEQLSFLLRDEDVMRETFVTKEVAEIFGVTSSCVLQWRRRGWLDASGQDDGKSGAYYYSLYTIRDIQNQARDIIPYTKRYWMRILAARKEGRPIR